MSSLSKSDSRPTTQDRDEWHMYWKTQGQTWRREPEIDNARQNYLTQCLFIKADIEQGIYPFKGVKLSRADIEWLLATHENGRGPVDWRDPQQMHRKGLDLRGADLHQIDLRNLPLTNMLGGLNWRERARTPERRDMAAVHLEGAVLSWAHLEGAELYMAHLEKADLYRAHLEGASLRKAHLEGAFLRKTHFEGKILSQNFQYAQSSHNPSAPAIPVIPANSAILQPADFRAVFLNSSTDLSYVGFGNSTCGYARLADVHWEGTNLGVVDWLSINNLGDDRIAQQTNYVGGKVKSREDFLDDYREAVRANRQLAVALQNQGLNEEAARFAYRAQRLQRVVSRQQRKFGTFIFSLLLDLLAGYGYKPGRSVIAYLLTILVFASMYFILGQIVGPTLSPLGSVVFSLTSFHGRGFFPGGIVLDDPITVLAALEAVVGLTIEVSFIATFTQRFFGK